MQKPEQATSACISFIKVMVINTQHTRAIPSTKNPGAGRAASQGQFQKKAELFPKIRDLCKNTKREPRLEVQSFVWKAHLALPLS